MTAVASWPSNNNSQVLTVRSINNVIKGLCSYCDNIATGDTLYGYKLAWSQLSTNKFILLRASESAL